MDVLNHDSTSHNVLPVNHLQKLKPYKKHLLFNHVLIHIHLSLMALLASSTTLAQGVACDNAGYASCVTEQIISGELGTLMIIAGGNGQGLFGTLLPAQPLVGGGIVPTGSSIPARIPPSALEQQLNEQEREAERETCITASDIQHKKCDAAAARTYADGIESCNRLAYNFTLNLWFFELNIGSDDRTGCRTLYDAQRNANIAQCKTDQTRRDAACQ